MRNVCFILLFLTTLILSFAQNVITNRPTRCPVVWYNSDKQEIVFGNYRYSLIPVVGGTYTQGGTSEQLADAFSYELPAHQVYVNGFYMGQTEIPQWLWTAVMSTNPSLWKGSYLPVERIKRNDIQLFLSKLNSITGQHFRLPTEAEWEYAARGGNRSRGYKYSGSNNIDDVAWYAGNSEKRTHEVGTKQPNELGLYDMSGNVWEWCSDWFHNYTTAYQSNPKGPATGNAHTNRGGGWSNSAPYCRVSHRYEGNEKGGTDLGFRIVL